MTLPLIWTDEAIADLDEITEYIAQRNIAAAERLEGLVRSAAGRLPDHPFLYRPGRVAGTREAVVHPNYVLISEVTDLIRILAVQHARQQYP